MVVKRNKRTRRVYKKQYKKIYKKSKKRITKAIGFPQSMVLAQEYVTYSSLDTAADGTADVVTYRMGLFDPDYSIGGHQPHMYDQMSTLYNNCAVIGGKVTAFYLPSGTDAAQSALVPCMWGLGLTTVPEQYQGATYAQLLESPMTTKAVRLAGTQNTVMDKQLPVTMHYSMKKYFKLRSVKDSDNDYWGVCGTSDPTKMAYVVLWNICPPGAGIEPAAAKFMVRIRLIVMYKTLKYVDTS